MTFKHLPHRLTERQIVARAERQTRCIGCGKFGVFFCAGCQELNSAVEKKITSLRRTLEEKFAKRLRGFY